MAEKFRINKYPTYNRPAYMRPVYTSEKYYLPRKYSHISRYSKVLTMSEFGLPYHEISYKRGVKSSSEDKYFLVSPTAENRLDMIALEQYGSPIYWWVIAEANNIIDPFNVPVDTVIRIPPLSSVYAKGGVLGDG